MRVGGAPESMCDVFVLIGSSRRKRPMKMKIWPHLEVIADISNLISYSYSAWKMAQKMFNEPFSVILSSKNLLFWKSGILEDQDFGMLSRKVKVIHACD